MLTGNRDMTTRYTDNDLIWALASMTLEKLQDVSNRDIIKNKDMPTHHTYGNRFGSLADAKEKAGITGSYTEINYGDILKFYKKVLLNDDPDRHIALDFPINTNNGMTIHVPMYIEGIGSIDILPEDPSDTIIAVGKFRQSVIPHDHKLLMSIYELPEYIQQIQQLTRRNE